MAVPLLAPQLGVGLAAIAGFAAVAIAKFFSFDPEIQAGLPVGEPWVILIYALFGGVLLAYRVRSLVLEREMARLLAERAAAEQLARALLRLRDYANTPIQTIAFATELIHKSQPELPVLARLDRAVESLKELSQALTRYESAYGLKPGDESLDFATLPDRLPGSGPGDHGRRSPSTAH
jgi:hypothetical protein